MATSSPSPRTVDEYIAGFPHDVQVILEQMRATIRKAAPDAEETIKYRKIGRASCREECAD